MPNFIRPSIAAAVAALCMMTLPALAEEAGQSSRITVYDASFFAKAQPYSAFDMLALLPGYTFSEADADVRGFVGAAGNVLIDGDRPASKHESLETILRRIPANSVSRVELIRPGARGVDMQGRTVLANVVRIRRVQTRGSAELESNFYDRGLSAPRLAGEFSRQSGEHLLEVSAARYRTVDDEHGIGHRPRVSADGDLLRATDYVQDEGERVSEFAAGYEQKLAGGKLRLNASLTQERFRADIREDRTFPGPNSETVVEFERESGSELGLHYDRALGERLQFELFGIQRNIREREGERSVEGAESSLFRQDSDADESILRGLLRRTSERWTVEGGVEGALNVLDSHSQLQENDIDVPLPAASVRVEERRGEAFAMATWRMNEQWTFEAGSRFESSQLIQSGDSNVRKSFFFAKPRALISFSPAPDQQWRLVVERRVGQLDFDDFVSSTSLSANTVTAGNPDLEPDRSWLAEIAWEKHFTRKGSLVLMVRHEQISDLIDRLPVAGPVPFDGVGNIGDGVRDELEININVPLQSLGLPSGLLKATALWRKSEATDPTTGAARAISEDVPREAALHFTQDLPAWNTHWGIDVEFASVIREYHFDEIHTDRLGTMVNVFAEYEPAPAWNVRLSLNNLTDRKAERERRIYDGMRGSAPLSYIETRSLQIGPYVGLSVRRAFGG